MIRFFFNPTQLNQQMYHATTTLAVRTQPTQRTQRADFNESPGREVFETEKTVKRF